MHPATSTGSTAAMLILMLMTVSFLSVLASLVVFVLGTSMALGIVTGANGFDLRIKTCNESNSGTDDTVSMRFCSGGSTCVVGKPNEYNIYGELAHLGAWNDFVVPLDYEPTTMEISKAGVDAWCMDGVVWDGGNDLLGRGARLFLDGDLGRAGCQYGVHVETKTAKAVAQSVHYPCQESWRFFNLQGSDSYSYEVTVKACHKTDSSIALASFCSEPSCNATIGDVIQRDLPVNTDNAWATTQVRIGFNPVAMKLTGLTDEWCADDILVNGYKLVDASNSPVRLSRMGEERHFYNIQSLGSALGRDRGNVPGYNMGDVAYEVMVTVIVTLTATAAVTTASVVLKRLYRSIYGRHTAEDAGGRSSRDIQDQVSRDTQDREERFDEAAGRLLPDGSEKGRLTVDPHMPIGTIGRTFGSGSQLSRSTFLDDNARGPDTGSSPTWRAEFPETDVNGSSKRRAGQWKGGKNSIRSHGAANSDPEHPATSASRNRTLGGWPALTVSQRRNLARLESRALVSLGKYSPTVCSRHDDGVEPAEASGNAVQQPEWIRETNSWRKNLVPFNMAAPSPL